MPCQAVFRIRAIDLPSAESEPAMPAFLPRIDTKLVGPETDACIECLVSRRITMIEGQYSPSTLDAMTAGARTHDTSATRTKSVTSSGWSPSRLDGELVLF